MSGDRTDTMRHHEVAPVTRFHDDFISDPAHSEADLHGPVNPHMRADDPEGGIIVEERPASSSASITTTATIDASDNDGGEELAGTARLVPKTTPFFHFDLAAAARAAEQGVRRDPETASYGTFDDAKKPQ